MSKNSIEYVVGGTCRGVAFDDRAHMAGAQTLFRHIARQDSRHVEAQEASGPKPA